MGVGGREFKFTRFVFYGYYLNLVFLEVGVCYGDVSLILKVR